MKTETSLQEYGIITGENVNVKKMAKFLADEIKNPLSRIFICVDQLKKSAEENNDSDFYINLINESGKAIEIILNDLIRINSINELKFKKRNLADLVKDNLSFAFENTEYQSIKVVESYSDSNIETELDEEKFTIALQNIIVNAIEAIENGEGCIEIEVGKKDNQAFVVIKDDGCGMSDEVMENLFVPFYSTKPKRKGLGLTVAHRIISAHNGKIEMKSNQLSGTEVRILLPLC